jgi:hypothetical protein
MIIDEYLSFLKNMTPDQEDKIKLLLLSFKTSVSDFGLDNVLNNPELILNEFEFRNNLRMFTNVQKIRFKENKCQNLK